VVEQFVLPRVDELQMASAVLAIEIFVSAVSDGFLAEKPLWFHSFANQEGVLAAGKHRKS
jgi:hypothetical protein